MSTIFISYRRAETTDVAGRISEQFIQAFSAQNVFKDVLSIAPGVAFQAYVEQVMARSSVAAIIIGPQWRTIAGEDGRPRLDDPTDLVRVEITTALRYRVPIVVLLVNGATSSQLDNLPPDLLALRQAPAITLRGDPFFQQDINQAVALIANMGVQRVQGQRQARIRRRAPWIAIISAGVLLSCVVACIGAVRFIGALPTTALNSPLTLSSATSYRTVNQMAALPNGEAWAVGSILAHHKDNHWQVFDAPSNTQFYGVAFDSATDGYAVGASDSIIHYHDNTWFLEYQNNTSDVVLQDVAALPNGEAWAIGGILGGNTSSGTILHRVKGQWQSVASPVSEEMNSIAFVGSDDGWIGTTNGHILHYDGTQWREAAFKGHGYVSSIAVISPADVWAVDSDQLYHFDGAGWEALPYDQISTTHAVAALPNGEAWAIGSSPLGVNQVPVYGGDPTAPQLFHEQNGTWTGIAHTSQNDLGNINSGKIFVVSSTDEWVYTSSAIWHGQNDVWTKEAGVF